MPYSRGPLAERKNKEESFCFQKFLKKFEFFKLSHTNGRGSKKRRRHKNFNNKHYQQIRYCCERKECRKFEFFKLKFKNF